MFFILGPQEPKTRKKLITKEGITSLQESNSIKRPGPKNIAKKPSSLSSVPLKHGLKDKVKNEFVIPELPEGRLLELKIFSNWGDKYLVGLNGIELFDSDGNPVIVEKVCFCLVCCDIIHIIPCISTQYSF